MERLWDNQDISMNKKQYLEYALLSVSNTPIETTDQARYQAGALLLLAKLIDKQVKKNDRNVRRENDS